MIVEVGGKRIGLDTRAEISFLSHAHLDHVNPVKGAKQIIASQETQILSGLKAEFIQPPKGIKLFNAGHMPGARQISIENGKRIVYTGDIRLKDGILEKGAEILECDELYIDATYFSERLIFPDPFEVYAEIQDFIRKNEGRIILFGTYKIGKAQEIIKVLNEIGITPVVDKEREEISRRYLQVGIKLDFVGIGEEGEEILRDGGVIITSMKKAKRYIARKIGEAYGLEGKTVVATGWALKYRFNVDKAFPLSDHADYRDILYYISHSQAKKIYLVRSPRAITPMREPSLGNF